MTLFLKVSIPILLLLTFSVSDDFCDLKNNNGDCVSRKINFLSEARYIFYDVNPPEGFNLRRDVYMRMAVFARKLRNKNWFLVLPPWPHLYHWMSDMIPDQTRLPWSLFFNVTRLSSFAPVIEMSDFMQTEKKEIDQVYVLQHFEDTFTKRNFEDRMKVEPCQEYIPYEKNIQGYAGYFWNYKNLTAKNVECLSFHGPISQLLEIVDKTSADTIMFDHAEIALHDSFGDKTYWEARKSMKFSDHLIKEARKFIKKKLNSTLEPEKNYWKNHKRTAVGGDYISIHLRRRDFVQGRHKDVPSIKGAALQIENELKKLNLDTVFVATDAPEREKEQLKKHLVNYKVLTYSPNKKIKLKYKDGGIAIIEQIICSHARKFIGTHESTFSFRIQEEREIMGFPAEMTFNRLCGDTVTKCSPPSKWLIVH